MGLDQLQKVETFFEKNKGKWISMYAIRKELHMNLNTANKIIRYLVKKGRIQKKEERKGKLLIRTYRLRQKGDGYD